MVRFLIKFITGASIIGFLLLVMILITGSRAQSPLGPPNQIICNQIATLTAGPTSATQIVALQSGQRIFICGWHITNTAAAGTWSFGTGTGSNCASAPTATIIPPQNVTSNAPSADHVDYAQLQTAQSVALCITPSVATIAGVVWFNQF